MADTVYHYLADTIDLHKPGYVSSSDPGAVGAGIGWVDTSAGTGLWKFKVRNATNLGWETAGGGGNVLTSGRMTKGDANGLPSDATNTDTDVADAVTKKHAIGGDTTLGTQAEALDMGNFQINNLAAPSTGSDAVTLKYLQNSLGVDLNYWLEAAGVMQTAYLGTPAFLTQTPTQEAEQELTSIVFRSSVAQTPTPFVIKNGTEFLTHFNAKVTTVTGKKTATIVAKLYYADADGTSNLTQIGASTTESPVLTATKALQENYGITATEVSIPSGKRLVLKMFSVCSGTAVNYPEINIEYGDVHDHVSIPATGAVFGNFLPLAGGTMVGDIAMGGNYQVTALQAPAANGEAIRATAKITEALLESATDLKHTQSTDSKIIVGDTEVSIADTGTDGTITLKADNATKATVDKDGVKVTAFTTAGVVHNAVTTGLLSSSKIVAADVTANTLTNSEFANLGTSGKIAKFTTNGLADGTNTDTDVASAVSSKHTQNTDTKIIVGDTEVSITDTGTDGAIILKPDNATQLTANKNGVILKNGTTIDEFSIDGTLAGNSDTAVPTEKAVKTYVDGKTLSYDATYGCLVLAS